VGLARINKKEKKMILTHKTDPYATHQPVMIEIFSRLPNNAKVLELGCGDGSTRLFNELAKGKNIHVFSTDDKLEWLDKYKTELESNLHSFKHIELPNLLEDEFVTGEKFDVVFIDQGEWISRIYTLDYFKDKADYVVLHDAYYYPGFGHFGKIIQEMIPVVQVGIVDYSDKFKSWKNFFPPLERVGGFPDTLVGSNFIQIDFECNMDI
jgi:SAM-dependent methyltransferase